MVDYSLIQVAIVSAAIILGFWIAAELIMRVLTRITTRAGFSQSQVRSIRDGFRIIWIILAIAGIVRVTGLTSEFTALTISGITGLAITLALQTTLQNMISGVLLFYDNTLRLHDIVEFSGVKGEIIKVSLRSTQIRVENGDIAIVSNTSISNGPRINHTAVKRLTEQVS